MVKQILTLLILVSSNFVFSQNSDWVWVKTFGGKGIEEILSACSDKSGNLYIAGYFQGVMEMEGVTLNSKGDNDILIAKFNKSGELQWVKQAGGTYSENLVVTEYAKKIKVDSDGNIIVAGCFMWEAHFDKQILKGLGNTDIFVAKYSSNGRLLWVRSYGGEQHDFFFDIDVDDNNNIYLTGNVTGAIYVDSARNENDHFAKKENKTTLILVKLNPNGDVQWLQQNNKKAENAFIKLFKNKIYYATEYNSDLISNEASHSVAVNLDFEVQCMNSEGKIEWEQKYGSKSNEKIESLNVGLDGSILISGKYGNTQDLKSNLGNISEKSAYTYFSKINSDGSLSWSVNNNAPPSAGGSNIGVFSDKYHFTTDIFTTAIDVHGYKLIPDGSWYNSYIALSDFSGKTKSVLLSVKGCIKSVIPISSDEYYVCGNTLSSDNYFYQSNNGGAIDFFLGLRKLSGEEVANQIESSESFENFELNIFPNPASNSVTISVDNLSIIEQINITNQEGKLIDHFSSCKNPFTLNILNYINGTYHVSVVNQNTIISKKLIVNK